MNKVGPSSPTRDRVRAAVWNRFTPVQILVMGLATVAPLVILGAVGAALVGLITTETMIEIALGAGENPGMVTFGAMFLATPVQWLTGRSQVRVRKYLGVVFFLLALSNLVMFLIPEGLAAALGAPFLVAGTLAFGLALPLFLTSGRWAQRTMGMRRWRALHKLTYVVAVVLLAHVVLLGDIGPGFVLITLGFIARIPPVRRMLEARSQLRSRPAAREGALGDHRVVASA